MSLCALICTAVTLLCGQPSVAQSTYQAPQLENQESWTLVVVPDVQGYVKNSFNQPVLELMTQWIAANADRLNTRMVVCVGDMVEQNDRICNGYSGDQSSHKQWQASARAFSHLNGVVPYITVTGNHDYTYSRNGERRTHLDEYFPIDSNPLNVKAMCQYGLDSQGNHSMENSAFKIRANDKDYIFLNVEFAPRDTVVAWAKRVAALDEYKSARIILTTHSYLKPDNTRVAKETKVTSYEPVVQNGRITKFKQPLYDANSGEQLWTKLVQPADNIELVLCGHISGTGFRSDKNAAGRNVHQMLFDAQSDGGGYEGNGGDGWIRILEFLPDGVTVKVTTFSPLFAISPTTQQYAWRRDAINEYTFKFSK